jgi:hypothetical protein
MLIVQHALENQSNHFVLNNIFSKHPVNRMAGYQLQAHIIMRPYNNSQQNSYDLTY